MGFLSIFLNSSVIMGLVALVFTVIGIRCLIYGVMGGTSTILRIICTIVFALLAYYCWRHALSIQTSNVIDRFVYDAWIETKRLFYSVWNMLK